jgi:aspartate/methionine/tyrosine aminotransferase
MYDFEWPKGGMFVWMKFSFENHPLWGKEGADPAKLAKAVWVWLTRKPYLVLGAPGTMFSPNQEVREKEGWKHVRLCFAAIDEVEVNRASERFAQGVSDFWSLKKVKDLDEILDETEAKVNALNASLPEEERPLNLGGVC